MISASPPSVVAALCAVVLRAWVKGHSVLTEKSVGAGIENVGAALLSMCLTVDVVIELGEARKERQPPARAEMTDAALVEDGPRGLPAGWVSAWVHGAKWIAQAVVLLALGLGNTEAGLSMGQTLAAHMYVLQA